MSVLNRWMCYFLLKNDSLYQLFDKFIWLARDPRDSYLSAFEIKFAYIFWFPGKKIRGIDVGLLQRWRLIYRQLFKHPQRWHLVRYEDIVSTPKQVLRKLFRYLEVPYEDVYPFTQHNLLSGGDPKLRKTHSIHKKSLFRHRRQMPQAQQKVFMWYLRQEMFLLGYL
jgi:hypothetical protein